jgi:AraC-like DNA-binding protein
MRRTNREQLISATILKRAILGTARAAGADTDRYLAQLGHGRSKLDDPDAWLPATTVEDFLDWLGQEFDHPAPGIWVGEKVSPESADLLGYAMRTSSSLGEAFGIASRYYGLVGTGVEVYYREIDSLGLFTHAVPPGLGSGRRHRDELLVASLVTLGRSITSTRWDPSWVTFQHAEPEDVGPHRVLFGDRVRFAEPATELAVEGNVTALPCLAADEALHHILDRYARSLVGPADEHPPVVHKLRDVIMRSLPAGDLSLGSSARALGMSARTLQRRLREAGTSHKELLQQTRYYLAERYLRSPELSIDEVSFLLGYANTPSFTRAFKEWSGVPPTEYRVRESGASG